MISIAGKGHLLGRDIEYQDLSPGSLLVGEQKEVEELKIGANGQVLTVVNGALQWQTPSTGTIATGQNLGAGERVLANVTNGHFQFRTILPGPGIIATEGTNEITLEVDIDALSGLQSSGVLGQPTDGSLTDPMFPGAPPPAFLTWNNTTKVVDAIDDLNEMMGLLLPEQPPYINDIVISMSGGANSRSGANILLSSGVTNNTGVSPISAGTQIYRVPISNAMTAISPQFGPGNGGTLSAKVNNVVDGNIILGQGDNTGTDGSLIITSDDDYPLSTPGFWEAITARISSTVSPGLNSFQMNHTSGGDSNKLTFLYDDINLDPNASGLNVTEGSSNPPLNYSSGIPHLSGNSIVNVTATVDNLSSNAYLSEGIIQIGSVNIGGASGTLGNVVNVNPGTNGIPSILSVSHAPVTVNNVSFTISNSTFLSSNIRIRGRNPNTDGAWEIDSFVINALSTIPSNKIDELNVPVNVGLVPSGAKSTAERVLLGATDNPDPSSVFSLLDAGWDSSVQIPAHESSVMGGILQHDVTNYSFGYIPSGPDYSTHNANQYVTWFFRRSAVSSFNITISGTYSGLWVTLADVNFGIAPNGWLDMSQLYVGAGIPGQNGSNGCAVGTAASGNSGTFNCTFGPETSSNATNNIILVRFKMSNGQKITSLSF